MACCRHFDMLVLSIRWFSTELWQRMSAEGPWSSRSKRRSLRASARGRGRRGRTYVLFLRRTLPMVLSTYVVVISSWTVRERSPSSWSFGSPKQIHIFFRKRELSSWTTATVHELVLRNQHRTLNYMDFKKCILNAAYSRLVLWRMPRYNGPSEYECS